MDVLVTAGATRNPVDAMRVLTARSSGTTGVEVARAVARAGARVHVLGNPEACLRGADLSTEEYGSTRDLMARMEAWVRAHPDGRLVHASAVGDYEAASVVPTKIPSGQERVVIELVRAPKIADQVRGWGLRGLFVTFKAASPETTDDDLVAIADAQRLRTGSDLVFANVIGRLGSRVAIVGAEARWFERRPDAIDALVSVIVAP